MLQGHSCRAVFVHELKVSRLESLNILFFFFSIESNTTFPRNLRAIQFNQVTRYFILCSCDNDKIHRTIRILLRANVRIVLRVNTRSFYCSLFMTNSRGRNRSLPYEFDPIQSTTSRISSQLIPASCFYSCYASYLSSSFSSTCFLSDNRLPATDSFFIL